MICLKCRHNKTKVYNSRYSKMHPQTWRRRQCLECSYTFTTYEIPSYDQLLVKQTSGIAPFHYTTLLLSIARCFEHTPRERAEHSEALTHTIIVKLIQSGDAYLTKKRIAETCYASLKRYDHLASVQYAAQHADILRVRFR
jgi:transcriptional repressor NrdR